MDRSTVRHVLLVALILFGGGIAGAVRVQEGRPPVFLWPMVFVEDALNPDLSAPTVDLLRSAWEDVRAQPDVFVGGQVIGAYDGAGVPPSWLTELNVAVGYSGELHTGPYPVAVEYLDPRGEGCGVVTAGLDWNAVVATVQDRYSQLLDQRTGLTIPGTVGGPSLVAERAQDAVTFVVSRHWEAAPVGRAIRGMPGVAAKAIEIGPFPSWFARTGRPEAAESWSRLFERELMWYQGVLNFVPDDRHQSPGRFNELPGNRPHVVAMPVIESRAYALADIWEWAYNNATWGCTPPDLASARLPGFFTRTPDEAADYLAAAIDGITGAVPRHIARFGRSRYITAADLNAIIEPGFGRVLALSDIDVLAGVLADPSQWTTSAIPGSPRRPPRYLTVGNAWVTLGEAFDGLSATLAAYARDGSFPPTFTTRPFDGPRDVAYPGAPSSLAGTTVTFSAVVDAASAYRAATPTRVPDIVDLNGVAVNPAEFLHAMAITYEGLRRGDVDGTVSLLESAVCPIGQEILEQTFTPRDPFPLFHSSLQLWTMKPATFRGFSDYEDTPPRIPLAGWGLTDVTEEDGGTLQGLAYAVDPDGEDLDQVNVFAGLAHTGLILRDDGRFGDLTPFDRVFTLQGDLPPGTARGSYFLPMNTVDRLGNASSLWPFLEVGDGIAPFRFRSPQGVQPPLLAEPPGWWNAYDIYVGSGPDSHNFAEAPRVLAAGYNSTLLLEKAGGTLEFAAAIYDPQGLGNVRDVRVFYEGVDMQVSLTDLGSANDGAAFDGVFGARASVDPYEVPSGRYRFTIVAIDWDGNASLPWPYLTIPRRRARP